MNDQHPFDITPDDDRRAVDENAQHGAAQPFSSESPAAPAVQPEQADLRQPDAAAVPAPAGDGAPRRRAPRRRIAALSVAAAVIFAAGAGGGVAASFAFARSTTATSATANDGSSTRGGPLGQSGQNGFGDGTGRFGQFGPGGTANGSTGSGTSTNTATAATADQIVGLVTIVTKLGYEDGEAAGTGIILTSGGRILTNNHVIDGATSIKVTVETTGTTYTADVVGTNATKDVAVLQLEDASGLTPASLATATPSTGDAVTAVGNANGTGTLSAAAGTVSALDQPVTTSSEGTTAGESLTGMIEISADVVSGDSGGAVENADGDVVGVTTAASSGSADVTGFAIPIGTAVRIAKQIVAGDDTSEITIGLPAFLGVSISSDSGTSGAVIAEVLSGTAAAKTDLAAGDTVTSVDGTAVTSGSDLSAAIAEHAVGDSVKIGYTDASGDDRTATVTLTAGPAD